MEMQPTILLQVHYRIVLSLHNIELSAVRYSPLTCPSIFDPVELLSQLRATVTFNEVPQGHWIIIGKEHASAVEACA